MGFGGRRLGGSTHKEANTAIPDSSHIWFDEEGKGSPSFAPFSLLKSLILAAVGQGSALEEPAHIPVIMAAGPQSITGVATISIATHQTLYTADGTAQLLTLPDGSHIGQIKVVTKVVETGEGHMTPDNFVDGTRVAMQTNNEQWEGMWTADGWVTLELSNRGAGTLPVIE